MLFRFEQCELDADRLELKRDGEQVAVEPQVLRLLIYLIENRHRAVGRSELHSVIWQSRIVTDATLNSRIRSARVAIGHIDRAKGLIRTLPRIGYRFTGDVEEVRITRSAARADGDVGEVMREADDLETLDLSLPTQPSVAVLPFRAGGAPDQGQLLADGLSNDVITQVSRARWLFVVARGSAFRFRNGPYDPREISRALGVRYVVQGTVRTAGSRLHIHVDLADAVAGREVWAETYQRDIADIVSLQAELAEVIVGAIESEIEHAEQERALLMSPATLDAWGAYHRGCWHMYRFTPDHYVLAEQYFKRSMELDPASPRAYAGLSFVHWQRAFLELNADVAGETQSALRYAEQSLSIDPRDPLGHWSLGRAYLLSGDLDLAVDELGTATSLNPSSAIAQYSLSYALMQTGDAETSNEVVRRARRLSPYDSMTFAMYAVRAQNLAFLGEHSEAARFATRAATQPNAHYHVVAIAAFCNMLAGNDDDARKFFDRLKLARPDYTAEHYLTAFRHRREENARLVRRTFRELTGLGPG